MESPKLNVQFSKEFFQAFDTCIKQLELISSFPLDPKECDKGDVNACDTLFDLDTFEKCDEIQGVLNIKMLRENCAEIRGFLEQLKNELKEEGTFQTMIDFVEKSCAEYLKDVSTIEEYIELKETTDKIDVELKNIQENEEIWLKDAQNRLFQAKFQFYQSEDIVNVEREYARQFTRAQTRQNDLKIQQDEDQIMNNIDKINFTIDHEIQSTESIIDFYKLKISELKDEAAYMSMEYDRRTEEAELNYQIASSDQRKQREMIEKERKIFDERQKQIDDYLAYKARKAAEKKLREKQEVKSVKIQAWWRGIMVRLYLGSFKKLKRRARKIRQEIKMAKLEKSKAGKKGKK